MKKSLKARFEEKVKFGCSSDCWEWQAGLNNHGYGTFFIGGKTVYAHRVSYQLYVGEIPEGDNYHGFCILHKCDNPSCVNPQHLFIGTHADNMRDKKLKCRTNNGVFRGESHPRSKLTKLEVKEIRELYKTGNYTQKRLGKLYGLTQGGIQKIVSGNGWNHI